MANETKQHLPEQGMAMLLRHEYDLGITAVLEATGIPKVFLSPLRQQGDFGLRSSTCT
jgi:hypothetical protein